MSFFGFSRNMRSALGRCANSVARLAAAPTACTAPRTIEDDWCIISQADNMTKPASPPRQRLAAATTAPKIIEDVWCTISEADFTTELTSPPRYDDLKVEDEWYRDPQQDLEEMEEMEEQEPWWMIPEDHDWNEYMDDLDCEGELLDADPDYEIVGGDFEELTGPAFDDDFDEAVNIALGPDWAVDDLNELMDLSFDDASKIHLAPDWVGGAYEMFGEAEIGEAIWQVYVDTSLMRILNEGCGQIKKHLDSWYDLATSWYEENIAGYVAALQPLPDCPCHNHPKEGEPNVVCRLHSQEVFSTTLAERQRQRA